MIRRISAARLFLLASIPLGCSEGDRPAPVQTATPSGAVRSAPDVSPAIAEADSAEVRLVVTPGDIARAPLLWTVEAQPLVRVGMADGDAPYLFDDIRGIGMLPSGDVLVVDGGSRELRVFDRDGLFQRAMGGRGRGPGEFEYPRLVPTPGTDSVLIFDKTLGRFTVYDGNLQSFQVLRFTEAAAKSWELLGTSAGHVLSRIMDITGGGPPGASIPDGVYHAPWTLEWIDLQTGSVSRNVEFPGPALFRWERGAPVLPYQVLFSPGAVGVHRFWLAAGYEPAISQYAASGQLEAVLRIDEPRRLVTAEAFDSSLERVVGPEAYERARGSYTDLERPVLVPAFQDLLVDADGWLWARLWGPPESPLNQWMVFGPDGRARGTIDLPWGLKVQWIGSDVVLGVRRVELEVEIVEAYRLGRTD